MVPGGKGEASAGLVREPAGSISLGRLLVAFLKIGSIGFGGGMAVKPASPPAVVQFDEGRMLSRKPARCTRRPLTNG